MFKFKLYVCNTVEANLHLCLLCQLSRVLVFFTMCSSVCVTLRNIKESVFHRELLKHSPSLMRQFFKYNIQSQMLSIDGLQKERNISSQNMAHVVVQEE